MEGQVLEPDATDFDNLQDAGVQSVAAQESFQRLGPQEIEIQYLKYHSSTVFIVDVVTAKSLLFISCLFLTKIGFLSLRQGYDALESFPFLFIIVFLASFFLGVCPTLYFSQQRLSTYLRWREFFVFNSIFWSFVRYSLCMGQLAINAPSDSKLQFILKILLSGPYPLVSFLSIAYPLRLQVAFPLACIVGVASTATCFIIHSQLVLSSTAKENIKFLADAICSRAIVKDFAAAIMGFPCSADNVLFIVWGAQSCLAVIGAYFYMKNEEKKRRVRFFRLSGLEEPYPLFWDDNYGYRQWLVCLGIAGFLGAAHCYILEDDEVVS